MGPLLDVLIILFCHKMSQKSVFFLFSPRTCILCQASVMYASSFSLPPSLLPFFAPVLSDPPGRPYSLSRRPAIVSYQASKHPLASFLPLCSFARVPPPLNACSTTSTTRGPLVQEGRSGLLSTELPCKSQTVFIMIERYGHAATVHDNNLLSVTIAADRTFNSLLSGT